MRFTTALTTLLPLALAAPGSLDQRQTPCAFPEYKTELVGDGDPHQNYYHIQLSVSGLLPTNANGARLTRSPTQEANYCGQATECSVGHEVSKSYTVGWSGGVSGFDFFSGGFEVQETWATGDTYTCTGKTGDTVCVWYIVAHTAYTVDSWIEYPGCPTGQPIEKERAVIKAPNKNNAGGNYDCRIGDECKAQGEARWA